MEIVQKSKLLANIKAHYHLAKSVYSRKEHTDFVVCSVLDDIFEAIEKDIHEAYRGDEQPAVECECDEISNGETCIKCGPSPETSPVNQQPVEMPELKSCPFCGDEAHVLDDKGAPFIAAACNEMCEAIPQVAKNSRADAIIAWNSRQPERESNVLSSRDALDTLEASCTYSGDEDDGEYYYKFTEDELCALLERFELRRRG